MQELVTGSWVADKSVRLPLLECFINMSRPVLMAYETKPKSILSRKGLPYTRIVKKSESKFGNRRVEIPNNNLHELGLFRLSKHSTASDIADGTDSIIFEVAKVQQSAVIDFYGINRSLTRYGFINNRFRLNSISRGTSQFDGEFIRRIR